MWELVVNLVGPVALDMLRDTVFKRKAAPAVTGNHPIDTEARLLSLEKQVEALREDEAKRVEELTQVLRVIGLRASVALWLSILSTVTTILVVVFVLFRS